MSRFTPKKYRDNPAEISGYLTEKLKENDITKAREALGMVMRAQNVQILARDAGLRRDALYRTFGGRTDPQLTRVLKLLVGLGVSPSVVGEGSVAQELNEALHHPTDPLGALSAIVKAQNVTLLAAKLGVMRTTIYKTFGGVVDPTLGRVLALLSTFDVRLEVLPAPPQQKLPKPTRGRPRKHADQSKTESDQEVSRPSLAARRRRLPLSSDRTG